MPVPSQAAPVSADLVHVQRRAGRVVFVGPRPTVLLLSGRDPSIPGAREFWFVPGGGAEAGETVRDAARREVHEEVGAHVADLGPVVWQRRVCFSFDGAWYEQNECFFVVPTERFDPRPLGLTELEVRMTTGVRWWPLDELATAPAVVHPRDLAALVASWLSSGPPSRPLEIE